MKSLLLISTNFEMRINLLENKHLITSKMEYQGLSSHINFLILPDPTERFEMHEVIGEGTYGEVYSARDRDTDKWVAVKILENITDNMEEIEEEYLILRDLCLHPNIPIFYGLFLKRFPRSEEDQLWFVMELCTGGSVTDLVQNLKKRNGRMKEEHIAYILRETMDALAFLHANHCMHRDVKGHNILLTEDGHVKLVDFGVSSHLACTMGRRNTSVGTPYWMAPEVIACEQQYDYSYDVRCDVWSIGITAIELADGDPPLAEIHPMRALFQIPRNPPPTLKKPSDWSEEFNDFISECLVKDFEQRSVIRQLMEHPFVKLVMPRLEMIRRELQEEIRCQLCKDRIRRAPEVTTKHGKLKSNRKSKLKPIYRDDLASLENLTEDIVVDQLHQRYIRGHIYTYIGDILIAINPFHNPGIYSEEHGLKYRGQARPDNPPHIYAVADIAFHAMLHHKQNQCIVISGESGAGKTESANLLLKQFVALGQAPNRNLEEKILQVNPIMEAFGNAKTGINDNSSRFGKFLELTFTKSGRVTGAKVHVYLLEQSRVVFQALGERNFHIFYYLYDGLEACRLLDLYHLPKGKKLSFRYRGSSEMNENEEEINRQKFKNVVAGFELLGFTTEEIDTVYRILAAILNAGDIDFVAGQAADNTDKSSIKCIDIIGKVANLLGVNPDDLVDALTSNNVVTRGEIIQRNNTIAEAHGARDSMAKALYGRLFDWLVNRINRLLVCGCLPSYDALGVGLLDIFGFENYQRNSFEQLCINIANEQIQYYFNQHIFTWEQQEYMCEGIDVDIIEFCDNRPVLDMFLTKPMGLLALLDEESHFPKATDRSLVEKFHTNIRSSYYHKPKSNGLNFTIQHYAGPVTYNSENFLEKNRNFLPLEIIQLLRQSKYDIIRSQFQCPLTKTGNLYSATNGSDTVDSLGKAVSPARTGVFGSKCKTQDLASQTRAQQTVATYFRYSLMDLLQKMVHGAPHFVRCIKPNDKRVSGFFSREKVLLQLRYTGILETIRIRQQGYSHRVTFAEFIKRYYFLAFGFNDRIAADRDNARILLLRLKLDGWALGVTKVFLKYYHVEYLTRLYEEEVRKIIIVQACVRRWLVRVRLKRKRQMMAQSALTLQKYARGWLARKRLGEIRMSDSNGHCGNQSTNGCSREDKRSQTSPLGSPTKRQRGAKDRLDDDDDDDQGTLRPNWGATVQQKLLQKHQDKMDHRNIHNGILTADKAASIIQKFFRKWRDTRHQTIQQQFQKCKAGRSNPLITFAQQAYQSHQDVQVILKPMRNGITVSEMQPVPSASNGFHIPHFRLTSANVAPARKVKQDAPKVPHSKIPVPSVTNGYDRIQTPEHCRIEQKRASPPAKGPTPGGWKNRIQAEKNGVERHVNGAGPAKSAVNGRSSVWQRHGIDEKPAVPVSEGGVFDFKCLLRKTNYLANQAEPQTNGNGRKTPTALSEFRLSQPTENDDYGPYDFKRVLRKTSNAPTESLRRRHGLRSPEKNSTNGSAHPVSSPLQYVGHNKNGMGPIQKSRPNHNLTTDVPPMLRSRISPQLQFVGPGYNL